MSARNVPPRVDGLELLVAAAKRCNIARGVARRDMKRLLFPATRIGTYWYVKPADFAAYAKAWHAQPHRPSPTKKKQEGESVAAGHEALKAAKKASRPRIISPRKPVDKRSTLAGAVGNYAPEPDEDLSGIHIPRDEEEL